MNMPKRLTPEPTTFINIGDSMIPISTLPENIAQEFLLIDRLKSEAVELTYRLEVITLAIKAKTQEIGVYTNAYFASKQKRDAEETVNKEIDK